MGRPSIKELSLSFLRLGLTAFGGPAMVAYIKELSVGKKKWLDEETFKDGVALCQSIPGATAMQTAAYVGLRSRGVTGALVSYVSFGLPAFILMLIFSAFYARTHELPKVISLFNGLQVIVVAIIANAIYSFGRSTFKNYRAILIALISTILFWAGVSPFIVIIGAGLIGIALLHRRGDRMQNPSVTLPQGQQSHQKKGEGGGNKRTLLCLVSSALAFLIGLYFADIKLFRLAALMFKIDLFAFGGGFASLPLMLHDIVHVRGWMDSKTFMDGIALGQVTPGPIVITATFIGYLLYDISGAIVATLSILTPSFLILVISVPFLDRLKRSIYFLSTTEGILASFVGLLFYVAMKFALAVSWDAIKVLIGVSALFALLRKADVLYVVLIGGIISVFLL